MENIMEQLIKESVERFNKLSPEEQAEHRRLQRESWVRAGITWPKPKYRWVNGVKIYDSFKDYCND